VRIKWAIVVLLFAAVFTNISYGCSFIDVFHQVTASGNSITRASGGELRPFSVQVAASVVCVGNATLTLYEYRTPAKVSELNKIAVADTDAHGNFDLGKIEIGHYFLNIDAKGSTVLKDWFEVEVTDKVKPTESVLIDISPIHPDCKGGHEFIERKQ